MLCAFSVQWGFSFRAKKHVRVQISFILKQFPWCVCFKHQKSKTHLNTYLQSAIRSILQKLHEPRHYPRLHYLIYRWIWLPTQQLAELLRRVYLLLDVVAVEGLHHLRRDEWGHGRQGVTLQLQRIRVIGRQSVNVDVSPFRQLLVPLLLPQLNSLLFPPSAQLDAVQSGVFVAVLVC